MKKKKTVRRGNSARMIVSVSPGTQTVVNYYVGHCGYTPAMAAQKMIEIGDAAFRKMAAQVDARRELIMADAKLAEMNRGHSKRVSAVKRKKRALKAVSAQPKGQNSADA